MPTQPAPAGARAREILRLDGSEPVAALTLLGRWIAELADKHGFSEKEQFRLDMALTEVVTNIVSYAFSAESDPTVTVTIDIAPTELSGVIVDHGAAFDPLAVVPQEQTATLQDASISGRGLLLIRHFVDACAYERSEQANHFSISIRRTAG